MTERGVIGLDMDAPRWIEDSTRFKMQCKTSNRHALLYRQPVPGSLAYFDAAPAGQELGIGFDLCHQCE